jgi:parvulin-like peptidyl-prolyl isomerase
MAPMKSVFLIAAIAGSLRPSPVSARAEQPAPAKPDVAVVARVNGEAITKAEFHRMLGNPVTRQQLQQELGAKEPGSKDLERLAMRKLIHRRLMLQEASRRNIAVTNEELDKGMAALRRRFDDLKSFGQWMKDQGLDEPSLFATLREEMVATRTAGALVAGVRLTEEDVLTYYQSHKEDLEIEEVWIQVIAVKDKKAVDEIQKALKKGADFGRLAQQRSHGLRAAEGGNVGWVNAATLWPPMRDAVSTLKPGEAVGPLQQAEDFLIVRLQERRRGRTKTLAEARPEIEPLALAQKQQAALQAWVTEQEKKAKIEVFDR